MKVTFGLLFMGLGYHTHCRKIESIGVNTKTTK